MNKSSLKNFAIEARRDLMEKVAFKLKVLGIEKKKITPGNPMGAQIEINGNLYNRSSYDALVRKYNELGYEELVEESAYIWFNRLTALAYMECNGYIDEKIIYSTTSKTAPDIIDTYLETDFFQELSRDEQEKIHNLRDSNKLEEMYSILVEAKCQELSGIMPFMFTKRGDFSEILFPSGLLMENSILVRLRNEVADSKDEEGEVPVELIGWLYQFYNSEKKDEVFEGLKKNQKITKENIPAATQLFTPKWIVKYMVENSLGKLALESLGASQKLKENWKYYIESEKDEDAERVKIEELKILDPAMGSGHMLTYSFDVLFDIYEDLGWSRKDAVLSILRNNICGLEIDERAGQLASFAIMMKGREKFARLFKVLERLEEEEKFNLHTLTIQESNAVSQQTRNLITENNLKNLNQLIENFKDAKEYGSILKLEKIEKEALTEELKKLKEAFSKVGQISLFDSSSEIAGNWSIAEDLEKLERLIEQQEKMTEKYDVVITNPPYMGSKGYSELLRKYVEKNYKDSKSDLFAVFMEQCSDFTKKERYVSIIVIQSWMFLSSFEELRKNLIEQKKIESLIQLGYGVIGIAFGTTAFCLKNSIPKDKTGDYFRMFDKIAQNIQTEDCAALFRKAVEDKKFKYKFDAYTSDEGISEDIKSNLNGKLLRYQANQKDFEKIPGSPIAYWISNKTRKIFDVTTTIENISISDGQNVTGNNEKFLREFWEINKTNIGFQKKWLPYAKGGEGRKYYGNITNAINWSVEAKEHYRKDSICRIIPEYLWYRKGITWSLITSSVPTFRLLPEIATFDKVGSSIFIKDNSLINYLLGLLNTKVAINILKIYNSTVAYQVRDIRNIPLILPESQDMKQSIEFLTNNNINISKQEWDSRETSWDFENSPLLNEKTLDAEIYNSVYFNSRLMESYYEAYCEYWRDQFVQMHKNEEELNRLFIEIYGLQDEMDEKVDFEDITLLKKEAYIEKLDLKEENIPEDEHTIEKMKSTAVGYLYLRGVALEFDSVEIVKQFLSYALGCIMGRYSIDKPGLIMANSDDELMIADDRQTVKGKNGDIRHEIDAPKFIPDAHGVIPVVEEDIFSNDIVVRIAEFVKAVYGEVALEENLDFIAEALGKKKGEGSREVIRRYFIKDFYKDHLQRYKKRPIYWMMKSGKKDAFSALIYLHRYEENSIGRVRADYLIPYQEMLDNQRAYYERIAGDEATTPKDRKDAEKKLKDLDAALKELKDYANEVKHIADQKIKLDLDDGVKINYEKFGKVLGKI